jgi:hypothetical protein
MPLQLLCIAMSVSFLKQRGTNSFAWDKLESFVPEVFSFAKRQALYSSRVWLFGCGYPQSKCTFPTASRFLKLYTNRPTLTARVSSQSRLAACFTWQRLGSRLYAQTFLAGDRAKKET